MEKLKENACSLIENQDFSNYQYYLTLYRQNGQEDIILQHNENLYIAPHILFKTEIIEKLREYGKNHQALQWTTYDNQSDFEECFEDLFVMPMVIQNDDSKKP